MCVFPRLPCIFRFFLLPLAGAKPDSLYCYISWSILSIPINYSVLAIEFGRVEGWSYAETQA